MPHEIIFEPNAVEHLQGFSARNRSIVLDQIEVQLTYQPDVETRNHKRLRPNPLAPWELRIGEIRVFYDVNADVASVRVIAVGRKEGNRLTRRSDSGSRSGAELSTATQPYRAMAMTFWPPQAEAVLVQVNAGRWSPSCTDRLLLLRIPCKEVRLGV